MTVNKTTTTTLSNGAVVSAGPEQVTWMHALLEVHQSIRDTEAMLRGEIDRLKGIIQDAFTRNSTYEREISHLRAEIAELTDPESERNEGLVKAQSRHIAELINAVALRDGVIDTLRVLHAHKSLGDRIRDAVDAGLALLARGTL